MDNRYVVMSRNVTGNHSVLYLKDVLFDDKGRVESAYVINGDGWWIDMSGKVWKSYVYPNLINEFPPYRGWNLRKLPLSKMKEEGIDIDDYNEVMFYADEQFR